MLQSTNPFNDESWKKTVLESEGMSTSGTDEYEILDPSGDEDIKSLVSRAPSLPKSAKNIIMDASALAKSEKEGKAREMTLALNTVFSNYNKKYGTDLSISFEDLSKTLINVSDPESRRVLELYTSEVFKSIRPVLLLHVLQKLTVALDVALDPGRLLDTNSFSPADSIVLIEKLMGFIVQIQDMIKEIEIPDSDMLLKKLADSKETENLNSEDSKKVVDEFMRLLVNSKK